MNRVITLAFSVVLSNTQIAVFGQPGAGPFAAYDCRFYKADVEVPVNPIPQSELDAMEIPAELITELQKKKLRLKNGSIGVLPKILPLAVTGEICR